MLSSHARHGSCAGRRVDGAKLASGAVAASKRYGYRDAACFTGAGSWAAATPRRVTPMTAEIIDGGACKYSLVVVKIPQIRAQIRPPESA